MVKVWKAKETTLKIDASSAITITTSAAIDTEFTGSAITCNAKNITVTEPEGDVDKIDLLGSDTDGFQCAELDERPFGMAVLSGTLVLDSDEVLIGYEDTATTVDTNWSRYRIGDGGRVDVSALVNLTASTGEINLVLDNGTLTRVGDIRISGPDGHWEQDFNIKCLPEDFYLEIKD